MTGILGARNGVHERDIDLHGLGDQVLNFTQHLEVVLGLDVFRVGSVKAGNEASKRSDSDTFSNAKYGCRKGGKCPSQMRTWRLTCVDVGCAGFECGVRICDGWKI